MSTFAPASPLRRQLAGELRGMREAGGLTGMELSRRIKVSQSKISRVEHAQQLPTEGELERWALAFKLNKARLVELVELRERAATEQVAWRRQIRAGLPALQAEVQAVEAAAKRIRLYHPILVPGLLQTPPYIRAVLEAFWTEPRADLAEAVAARVSRQSVLYETTKRIDFIIGEPALRWWPGPANVMAGQLAALTIAATLPNVSLAILPLDREIPVWHSHHFTIYDQPGDQAMVHLELRAGGENLRDPDDVARFTEAFDKLGKYAAHGDKAVAILDRLATQLRRR
jgi:transcriptional regulator with XRE-family HTH domain